MLLCGTVIGSLCCVRHGNEQVVYVYLHTRASMARGMKRPERMLHDLHGPAEMSTPFRRLEVLRRYRKATECSLTTFVMHALRVIGTG